MANSVNSQAPESPLTYYKLLDLHPSAGEQQIRQAYRELSRQYHPDTTELPAIAAKQQFQQINEAYATLSNPERRQLYDLKIGYSRVAVAAPQYSQSAAQSPRPKTITEQYESAASAYLDPTDRPLSSGELFALFLIGVTFVGCLLLAILVGLSQTQPRIPSEFAAEVGWNITLDSGDLAGSPQEAGRVGTAAQTAPMIPSP